MNLGRDYKRAKWEAAIILLGAVFWLIAMAGCVLLPTLTHPRSLDASAIDWFTPLPEIPEQ